MELTQSERDFISDALKSNALKTFIDWIWWPFYERLRSSGVLPKLGNPHVSRKLFMLIGHVFSVPGAIEDMRNNGIEHIIEQYGGDEPMIPAPWQTG